MSFNPDRAEAVEDEDDLGFFTEVLAKSEKRMRQTLFADTYKALLRVAKEERAELLNAVVAKIAEAAESAVRPVVAELCERACETAETQGAAALEGIAASEKAILRAVGDCRATLAKSPEATAPAKLDGSAIISEVRSLLATHEAQMCAIEVRVLEALKCAPASVQPQGKRQYRFEMVRDDYNRLKFVDATEI
jgi:hypothetical protein